MQNQIGVDSIHFNFDDVEHIIEIVARKNGIVKIKKYYPYLNQDKLPLERFIRELFKETASITERLSAWPGSREALRAKAEADEKENKSKWAVPVLQAWLNGYSPDSEEGQAVLKLVDKSFIPKVLVTTGEGSSYLQNRVAAATKTNSLVKSE